MSNDLIKCCNCGKEFSPADLSVVFYHEGDCMKGGTVKDVKYSSSKKAGEPTLITKSGRETNLN